MSQPNLTDLEPHDYDFGTEADSRDGPEDSWTDSANGTIPVTSADVREFAVAAIRPTLSVTTVVIYGMAVTFVMQVLVAFGVYVHSLFFVPATAIAATIGPATLLALIGVMISKGPNSNGAGNDHDGDDTADRLDE